MKVRTYIATYLRIFSYLRRYQLPSTKVRKYLPDPVTQRYLSSEYLNRYCVDTRKSCTVSIYSSAGGEIFSKYLLYLFTQIFYFLLNVFIHLLAVCDGKYKYLRSYLSTQRICRFWTSIYLSTCTWLVYRWRFFSLKISRIVYSFTQRRKYSRVFIYSNMPSTFVQNTQEYLSTQTCQVQNTQEYLSIQTCQVQNEGTSVLPYFRTLRKYGSTFEGTFVLPYLRRYFRKYLRTFVLPYFRTSVQEYSS